MSSPRFPGRDLRLERLSDRDGLRPSPYGEAAHAASPLGSTASAREFQAAYAALIDAVFLAPGAAEWLRGLGVAVAAFIAGKDKAARQAAREAIRPADGMGRGS